MQFFLPALSAVMLFLSFPRYISGYLAFIALVPFFYSLSRISSYRKALICGLIFGLIYSAMLSYPLFHTLNIHYNRGIIYSLVLIFITVIIPLTALSGIFSAACFYFRVPSKILCVVIPPSLWIIADYSREIIPLYIPWGFAGYTQVFTPLIQISDLTGIYGVTFFIILINILITEIIIDRRNYFNPAILIVIVLLVITYSYTRKNQIESQLSRSPASDIVRVTAIQGNFSTHERWDASVSQFQYSTYTSLSQKKFSETDIIIWPETVLNSADTVNLQIIKTVSNQLSPGQLFITGATRSESNDQYFNSVFITAITGIIDIYDKIILFPYSERSYSGLSAGRFLNAPEKFQRGRKQKIIDTTRGNIGITICFESIYPDFVRNLKVRNADFITNIANDSWFGKTSEPYIHLYSNIARAVELRIPVIRSTNNGISAIITQTGKISASTTLDTQEILTGEVSKYKISSIYAGYGDLILILSALILLSGILLKNKTAI